MTDKQDDLIARNYRAEYAEGEIEGKTLVDVIEQLQAQVERLKPDAERYRLWRDAVAGDVQAFTAAMATALPADVGARHPTANEWDAALDVVQAQKEKDDA